MEVHEHGAATRRRRCQDVIHTPVRAARVTGIDASKEVSFIVADARVVDIGHEDAGGRELLQYTVERIGELAVRSIFAIEQSCEQVVAANAHKHDIFVAHAHPTDLSCEIRHRGAIFRAVINSHVSCEQGREIAAAEFREQLIVISSEQIRG